MLAIHKPSNDKVIWACCFGFGLTQLVELTHLGCLYLHTPPQALWMRESEHREHGDQLLEP